MNVPQYLPQKHQYACSLAVLRMVLKTKGLNISEEELIEKVQKDYGKHFKNLWNPTIAKLARQYDIETTLYALWPLLKKDNLKLAISDYQQNQTSFNPSKYENKRDTDRLPEPLPLAYQEMFEAARKGCQVSYGRLTGEKIKKLLEQNCLIQTSIQREKLFPTKSASYHSILIYDFKDGEVFFHDPANGPSLRCTMPQLMSAMQNVGAAIVYEMK